MTLSLPVLPGLAPMEAAAAEALPEGPGWLYEPKWDGFRCLLYRDGDRVELRSKSGQALGRYFPELVAAARALPARRFVLDGEIVLSRAGRSDFDALLQRVHPAASRVERLSRETPAELRVFDLLVDARGRALTRRPLRQRREALASFARASLKGRGRLGLSPASTRRADALRWLAGREGCDGVMAKRLDLPYRSGERDGMVKVKRMRTADCVVAGCRKDARGAVASLLLGLYGEDGLLHHVGFAAAFDARRRAEAGRAVAPYEGRGGFTGRAPGGPSRWSGGKETPWVPLEPVLVVEVRFDHVTGARFRHGARFLRWRPDKDPRRCGLEQLQAP